MDTQESQTENNFISNEQIEELRNKAREEALKQRHSWKQKGGWLVCRTCPNPHAVRILHGYELTGIDDKGMPIVKRLK